jgi:hypothetical protein
MPGPMHVLIGVGVSLAIVIGLWCLSDFQRRRQIRLTRSRLQSEWGQPRASGADDGVGVYHLHVSGRSGDSLDETTWADLNLDAVFRYLDRNESALGRERLYHRLRRISGSPSDVHGFNATIERYRADEPARLAIQMAMATVSERHDATVWSLALDAPEALPWWMLVVCPAFAIGMATVLAVTLLVPAYISVTIPAILLSLWMRSRIAWRIYPWVVPFRSVSQIVRAAQRVAASEPATEPTTVTLTARLPAVATLATVAGLLGRDPARTDLASLLWEYLSFLFCIDGNVLILGRHQLRRCQGELREIAETLGDLESAISLASVRAGAAEWTQPVFSDSSITLEASDLRHPLVDPCVPNSITLGRPAGVILTGGNMTGKSTFLRSIGVNAVLAQTVATVFASAYRTPWLTVRTCISPTDDLEAGKSLYQREAETVVSILRQAAQCNVLLCLFDELFRGTNSADRIGASVAVFTHLVRCLETATRSHCLVVAATHDLELVPAVGEGFASYHFGDRITADRLEFDYRLRPGIAPSRNAVALLRLLGAPPALVADALHAASAFTDGDFKLATVKS